MQRNARRVKHPAIVGELEPPRRTRSNSSDLISVRRAGEPRTDCDDSAEFLVLVRVQDIEGGLLLLVYPVLAASRSCVYCVKRPFKFCKL